MNNILSKKIRNISAITDEDLNKLLYEFNDTVVDYPRDKCVHTLFEEQVEKTPEKVAVIACDKTLTYKELNEEANRIAHALIEKGVGVGNIVAFSLQRKSFLIPTIFGILKSGAAYLPIDLDYPPDRVDYILKDSKTKWFISEDNINEFVSADATNPNVNTTSDNNCYCIYTSGTTGNPKGTLIRHRNLVNFCDNNNNNYQHSMIKNGTRLISTFKCCFDAFGVDYALFLLNGTSLVLASDEDITNAEKLAYYIQKYNVDVIHATPSTIKAWCGNREYVKAIGNAKIIMVAAENFSPDLYMFLREKSSAKIFNGYGPSETTIGVSFGEITSTDIHIGKPNANTKIYIVNQYLKPTPIGVTGELCIAGDCVGAGYLNRPELTAERFIDNPFGKGKLYKTGDLAYWREDGNIVYVGRNDFQVKIRGLRIELGEIENEISSISGVTQAVVIVRKDDHDRQLICAFYTGKELGAKDIRSIIGEKLPKYMLPHIITRIDEIPLTPSGKINRKALPEVDLNQIDNMAKYIAPVTEREKTIANILAEILEVERVGLADDFFELGCDSLKAIEFISACHYEGIYFNLQSVFDHPTISALLQAVDNADHDLTHYDPADFEAINKLIAENTVDHIPLPSEPPVGNILLAGATGYLGAHILADFLEHDTGTAYCIVRGKNAEDSAHRLKEYLQFYFDDIYTGNDRIVVLCGDLTKERFGLSEKDYRLLLSNTDTVINSVASVKHYGSYGFFYETNVKSVINLIDFCKASDAKLIHISTTSVAGNDFDNQMSFIDKAEETVFTEHDLYIGQPLDNVYVRSKFEAEKAVLDAMGEGLQANIFRMGNLTNRRSDGKFQKNHESNAFLNRLKAIIELGCIPDYLLDLHTEFTPIDEAASAVMAIARHFRSDRNIFHIENTNLISFSKMFDYMSILGLNMKIVKGEDFGEMLRQSENAPETKHIYETFINDLGKDNRLNYESPIKIDTAFSNAYLRSLGFVWHETDLDYLNKYFAYFKQIGYIGSNEDEE